MLLLPIPRLSVHFIAAVFVLPLLGKGILPAQEANVVEADVCVYGATPAGVAAAVAAAREGAKVTLVEPADLIGGMMSSGLSFSDSNQMAREMLGGIFEEFHRRVEKNYLDRGVTLGYRVADKDQKPWVYEPHVAEKVFQKLLRDAGVQVRLNDPLRSVEMEDARIERVIARDTTVQSRVFIDATYEGDLMAEAGVTYAIGREPAHQFGEPLAGLQFPKPPVSVSPLNAHRRLLPLMTGRDAGDPLRGDRHLMVYSFRLCVTTDPVNRVPFPKPASYDPTHFELVKRYLEQNPDSNQLMDFYPLPRGKADVNNSIAGQISLGLVGASSAWPEADDAARRKIWQRHKDYTLGLIHFINNDPSVPERLRNDMQRWGLCKDEFTASEHWPPQLYVREARRMRGAYVMTQADVVQRIRKPDSIGIASFPIDSHDCQRVATREGGFVNEGTIFPRHIPGRLIGQPYQVPYRCLTPKLKECENLLVPVCISASHVAFSSIRVEPTWIVIGQSAGVAAALAVNDDVPVQQVQYRKLRRRLLVQKQIIDLSEEFNLPQATVTP